MKAKLGQQIRFTKDYKIQLAKGGTALVKAGDTATVVRKVDKETAEIVYLSGEAKGMSQNIPLEVDDTLDVDSIVEKLRRELDK